MPQEQIEERLVELARAGRSVVRLKGGDPFVFGRGGEEAEALREAGVEFEVVPGVTAGVAAPAYAGIPVTHREDASAVAFVTGHEDPVKEESALDWGALAAFPGTLVLYMGVKRLAANAAALVAAGRPAEEPAAVVERGTMDGQRTVVATLGSIAEAVEREGIAAPAIVVIGDAVGRRAALAWLERLPLHGRKVVVTRARAQASGLAAALRGLGAEVVELPAIRIEPALRHRGGLGGRRADRRVRGRLPDQPQRGARCCSRHWPSTDATPGRSPPPPSPRSGRAPPPPSPSTGSLPTSSPSASSPRPSPRPSRGSRSRGAAC